MESKIVDIRVFLVVQEGLNHPDFYFDFDPVPEANGSEYSGKRMRCKVSMRMEEREVGRR